MVQRMMNKIFMNLIGEFRKLGSKIIFASFNKLIIATNKQTLDAAQEYVNFIVDTVQARQLFSRMHLQPKKYWSTLLYNDIHNYGGILLHSNDDGAGGPTEGAVAPDGGSLENEELQSSANAVSPGSGKIIFDGSSETTLQGNLAGFVVDDDGDENIEYEDESSVNSAIMESNAEVAGEEEDGASPQQTSEGTEEAKKQKTANS